MAKLSQQLQEREVTAERVSRTERIELKQQYEKEGRDFSALKSRAEAKQKEFSEITSTEEYKQKYNLLDPELKQFFNTPTEIAQQQTDSITSTKEKVLERLVYVNQKLVYLKERYERQEQSNEDWYDRKSPAKRKKYYERYREKDRNLEHGYEEDRSQWMGYKEGLNKGLNELNKNKNISYKDIKSYAYDLGKYEKKKTQGYNVESAKKQEIYRLEQAGYKPFIFEKTDVKGRPQSVELVYISSKLGKSKTITEYKVKPSVDVAGLKPLGFSAQQERTLEYAGKEFKFKSSIPVFKTKSGEVVTPYERTGFTESQLIKQQQDIEYKSWQDTQKVSGGAISEKAYVEDKKGIFGRYVDLFKKKRKEQGDVWEGSKEAELMKKLGGYVKTGFKWTDERVHYDLSGSPSSPKLTLSFGKKEDPTIPEKVFDIGIEALNKPSQKIEEWVIGKGKIKEFETGLEKKYQGEYQTAFEEKYMKSLIYDETTFEKASKQFKESDEAKLLQESYVKEYEVGYKQLQTDVPFFKGRVLGGLSQTGLGLGATGLKILKSPVKTTAVVGAVYTGVGVLKALPPAITYTATAGLGAYGVYKFVSPKSTYIEAGGGLLIATLSGITLGYGAYRYLKSPVVKTVKIKPPKITLKSSKVIGKDLKIITKQGSINKVIYESQKLSQTAIAGRRTIVTTKGRVLFKKYTGVKLDPIYKGVPTQQLGKGYTLKSLRGTYRITTKLSGYQKASRLLQKYGWSEAQAKATLRYYAPKVTERYIRGELLITKGKAVGEFEVLTKQKVYDVNKALGIKTKGARTIKDIYRVERKIISTKKGSYVLEDQTRVSGYLKGDKFYAKSVEQTTGKIFAKTSELKKGYEVIDTGKIKVFKSAQYKDVEALLIKSPLKIKLSQKELLFDFNSKVIKIETTNTQLIKKIVDISKKSYIVPKGVVRRTPFAKTFGYDKKTTDLINQINKKVSTKNVQKVIKEINNIGSQTSAQVSKYYGTGQYERTVGGLDLQQGLRSSLALPDQKLFVLKDIINIKKIDALVGLKVGQLSAIGVSALKPDIKLKQDLKLDIDLKTIMKEDLGLKTGQVPALKTSSALKSQLKSLLGVETSVGLTSLLIPKIPKMPIIRDPVIPKPFVVPFLKAEIRKKARKGKRKNVYDVAYLPDFTSRALGLKPQTISEKEARKKLKKLLTGLEIRRGVIIK